MRIGGTVVVTPLDNPCQYEPDWRNSIALALHDGHDRIDPAYARYRNDRWIRLQLSFLRARDRKLKMTDDQMMLRLASIWFQGNSISDVRLRLEPLLLTAARFDTIALDILGSTECLKAIEYYEKLYFNIRDDEGRLSRSCQLRQYFALPSGEFNSDTPPENLWKMIATLMGYDTLVAIWLWKDAHGVKNASQEYLLDEMWRVAQSRLFMSMFANRVGHESMAKLLSAISAQQKMLHEDKDNGSLGLEMVQTMQNMLSLVSPSVINTMSRDVDAKMEAEAAQARLEAGKAVAEVVLGTTGKNGVKLLPGENIQDSGKADGLKSVETIELTEESEI